jgi:hypothetical protein
VPSIQLGWQHVRLVCALVWVWAEALPGLAWLVFAAYWAGSRGLHALGSRWALGALAVIMLYTWRAWRRGKFVANVADTYRYLVFWDWRTSRLTHWTLPKLVRVTVMQPYSLRRAWRRHQEDGIWGLPAAACRLELRPHSVDLPTEAWAYQLEWFVTSRLCFSQWEPIQPSRKSPHVLVLDMGELVIPDAVTAGEWVL